MRILCRRTLLWLGVCLLTGVVSGWAQQAVVSYQLTSVPTTVASTGDSEVLGSVRFQVTNVSDPVAAPTTTDVLAQAVQIVLNGISCDNNSSTGISLSFGTSAATPSIFSATNVAFAASPYDANNSIVPSACVIGLSVNVPNTGTAPTYGLPNVGDWFQVDGIRGRLEFYTGTVGSAINATSLLSSSVGSGEVLPPNSVQVASPFTVLAASITPGVYVNCINTTTYPATITVSEPYQADFVDYTIPDSSNGLAPVARPLFGATDSGTEILLTISNVPAGVTLTFPSSVAGNVPGPGGLAGDHLVLNSTNTGVVTGPVTTATVLYDYTCFNALACDTTYEVFAITPAVVGTMEGTTGVITAQAQVAPYDVTAATPIGGVPSFTSPPNTNSVRPRWSDPLIPAPTPFVTLVPCSTTLLFPWAVSTPGFDTGIVINNTTQDYTDAAALPTSVLIAPPNQPEITPTPAESGNCTLYYFPSNEAPALYYTSPSPISSGESWALLLSSTPFNGLTGYLIARCNFQYGHGYAAIGQGTSTSALTFTESYLALVIPDPVVLGYYGFAPSRLDYSAVQLFIPTGEALAQ